MAMSKEERLAQRRAHRGDENKHARERYAERKAEGWSKIRGADGKYGWMKDAKPRSVGRPRKVVAND
jgi:hypothetical protein